MNIRASFILCLTVACVVVAAVLIAISPATEGPDRIQPNLPPYKVEPTTTITHK